MNYDGISICFWHYLHIFYCTLKAVLIVDTKDIAHTQPDKSEAVDRGAALNALADAGDGTASEDEGDKGRQRGSDRCDLC